jgi:hypothetical protein
MTGVNVNGATTTLTGVLEDALFIVDIPASYLYAYPNAVLDSRGATYPTLLYNSTNDFYYGYTNVRPVNPLTIYFLDSSYGTVDISTFTKGKVYWFSRQNATGLTLTIPSLEVVRINL